MSLVVRSSGGAKSTAAQALPVAPAAMRTAREIPGLPCRKRESQLRLLQIVGHERIDRPGERIAEIGDVSAIEAVLADLLLPDVVIGVLAEEILDADRPGVQAAGEQDARAVGEFDVVQPASDSSRSSRN